MRKLLLPLLSLAAGCTPSIETKNEVEVKPIEIKPMQIQIDVNVNVRIQKELNDAFGELDAAENKM